MKKKVLTTIILIMLYTLASCQCVKAETEIKTTIQIKSGATSWTNISASDAYDKCQELNEDNSALGKTGNNVMAHLSTNADWFAVSVLTYSTYGSKSHYNTTGNSSGFTLGNMTLTSGISEEYTGTTNINMQSIIDNKNTKFVEIIKKVQNENKPGLGFLPYELLGTATYYYAGGANYAGKSPLSVRQSLFNINVGVDRYGCDGTPRDGTTFRPVIWVK